MTQSSIFVNSKEFKLSSDTSILEFLTQNGFKCDFIALEADGEIVPKSLWNDTKISKFKKYEVVEFVGGG